MKVGDRVKVVRIDDYTRDVCKAQNLSLPIGMVGIVEEIYYNPNMHRTEVVVNHSGDKYIWDEWNLSLTRLQLLP